MLLLGAPGGDHVGAVATDAEETEDAHHLELEMEMETEMEMEMEIDRYMYIYIEEIDAYQ